MADYFFCPWCREEHDVLRPGLPGGVPLILCPSVPRRQRFIIQGDPDG